MLLGSPYPEAFITASVGFSCGECSDLGVYEGLHSNNNIWEMSWVGGKDFLVLFCFTGAYDSWFTAVFLYSTKGHNVTKRSV